MNFSNISFFSSRRTEIRSTVTKPIVQANPYFKQSSSTSSTASVEQPNPNRDMTDQLMEAIYYGNVGLAEQCINCGANVNHKDRNGISMLMSVPLESKDDVGAKLVHLLVDKGAEINYRDSDGWTAIMFACYRNKTQTAVALLDENAKVLGLVNNDGMSALDYSKRNGNYELTAKIRQRIKEEIEIENQNHCPIM